MARTTPRRAGGPPPPWPPPLGRKHRQTLDALFARPTRTNITWADFVALMGALGAATRQGGGSAHSFVLQGRVGVFHRPHPGNELYPGLVRRIREFLRSLGVRP